MSFVVNIDGTYKEVANLGWLLRNWGGVKSLEVVPNTRFVRLPNNSSKMWEYPLYAHYSDADCILVADLGERCYVTTWASHDVLLDWLQRPVFYDVKLKWFGISTTVQKGMND